MTDDFDRRIKAAAERMGKVNEGKQRQHASDEQRIRARLEELRLALGQWTRIERALTDATSKGDSALREKDTGLRLFTRNLSKQEYFAALGEEVTYPGVIIGVAAAQPESLVDRLAGAPPAGFDITAENLRRLPNLQRSGAGRNQPAQYSREERTAYPIGDFNERNAQDAVCKLMEAAAQAR